MNVDARHPTPLPGAVLREVSYPAGLTQPRHWHDRTSLTLVFDGSLAEEVGRVREEAAALSVVLKPAGTAHANRVGPRGATTYQIELDHGVADDPDAPLGPDDWAWAHGGSPARRFLDVVRAVRAGEPAGGVEGRLLDLLAALREADAPADRAVTPRWLARVVAELEETFTDPRSVRELAADAAMHPVALARAHRRHYGCSITERLRARRVREAAARLRAPGSSIGRVAFQTGFSDQSHLTRVFRTETGLTPGAYRSLLAG